MLNRAPSPNFRRLHPPFHTRSRPGIRGKRIPRPRAPGLPGSRGFRTLSLAWILALALTGFADATPVTVLPVAGKHGMVVAGHPQATAAGLAVLKSGGNAVDAAIATSLSLGVAEPYGSGLGGKLVMVYYEAATGRTEVIDAMDAAGSLDVAAYLKRPEGDHSYGYPSACVPGLAAGLWLAHQKWGWHSWADDVQPAIDLAREGFRILPKTRDFFEEQTKKLHRGDKELARLYLPGGQLPEIGATLANPDLARTLTLLAKHGRDGFYRGEIAASIASASREGGGEITAGDLAAYEARIVDPVGIDFHGYRIESAPPPASGAAMFLPALKALEDQAFGRGPLRSAANLDELGRVWRLVEPEAYRVIGDAVGSRFAFEKLVAPDSIQALRTKAGLTAPAEARAAWSGGPFDESEMAATTHFIVVDRHGNVVCATQSLSLHFGAGVIPRGTGVVLNDSMSNFDYSDPAHPNFVAPGRRPRSTIAPTLVMHRNRPVIALGIPGAARIPTAMLQVLIDRLVLNRPLGESIGDSRFHFSIPWRTGEAETFEAEASFPPAEADALKALGWTTVLAEPAGRGRKFGGVNAVEFNADGSLTGYADPRRTNLAEGY
ncbi:MAG: gamma-glutamyltransferase [Verrucomicrobia bacterium]|nr:gamma-glutamyltransferase [Verrucomicrobiota bacterium]